MKKKRFRSGSRIGQVHDELKEMAYASGPNAKLPTARELCVRFGVGTVALNEALRELEAKNIIDRKQGSGLYVSPRIHEKAIAVIVGASFYKSRQGNPFWDNLLALLIHESQKRANSHKQRFTVYISVSGGDGDTGLPKNFVDDVNTGLVHGIIAIGLNDAAFLWIQERGLPFVQFGGSGWPNVSVDSNTLVRIAVNELARQGCQRIAFWAPRSFVPPSDDNIIASSHLTQEHEFERSTFVETFILIGGCFDPDLVQDNRAKPCAGLTEQEQGRKLARQLLAAPGAERPEGIVIRTDNMTMGVLAELRNSGIEIPRDIKIATHANLGSVVLYGHEDQLTCVAVDPLEIVSKMCEMLDVQLAGETAESLVVIPRLIR